MKALPKKIQKAIEHNNITLFPYKEGKELLYYCLFDEDMQYCGTIKENNKNVPIYTFDGIKEEIEIKEVNSDILNSWINEFFKEYCTNNYIPAMALLPTTTIQMRCSLTFKYVLKDLFKCRKEFNTGYGSNEKYTLLNNTGNTIITFADSNMENKDEFQYYISVNKGAVFYKATSPIELSKVLRETIHTAILNEFSSLFSVLNTKELKNTEFISHVFSKFNFNSNKEEKTEWKDEVISNLENALNYLKKL